MLGAKSSTPSVPSRPLYVAVIVFAPAWMFPRARVVELALGAAYVACAVLAATRGLSAFAVLFAAWAVALLWPGLASCRR